MTTITEYYGIKTSVPFVDVSVEQDTPLFVDPFRIRLSSAPHPHFENATKCLDSFFNSIASAILLPSPKAESSAMEALAKFREPRETRLGYTRGGFRGHGGAEDVGNAIWRALNQDAEALLRVGVLKRIEDIPLFVENVAEDRCSDITTRIAYGPLADFTNEMMRVYPELQLRHHSPITVERQIWDPENACWSLRQMQLPSIDGEPLLLVPKGWAGSSILMNSGRYFETHVLWFVQQKHAVEIDGRPVLPTKKQLLKQKTPPRGHLTNIEITLSARDEGLDLLSLYREWVASRHRETVSSPAV